MHRTRKLIRTAATATAGFCGFAVAAFVQGDTAGGAPGLPGTITHVSVPGTQLGVLLPGEKTYITLILTNPHATVSARLLPISAGDVVIDTIDNPADKAYCHDQIELSTVGADPQLPVLGVHATNHPYKMVDAIKLKADTDIRCRAMTFHTTWNARFQSILTK